MQVHPHQSLILAVRIGHFSKYNLLSILYCITFSSGPQHWHLDYPHCGGVKQSPIDIDTNDVIVDSSHLQPFMFSGYDSVSNVNMSMVNNGHTGEFSSSHKIVSVQSRDKMPLYFKTITAVKLHISTLCQICFQNKQPRLR